jgi:hypothetical protein
MLHRTTRGFVAVLAAVGTGANWQAVDTNASTGNQKTISKSLMPFHFPGWLGSNDVFSTQIP